MKFVEMVENLRIYVMMEILMKMMDVLLNVRLKRDGHVLAVPLLSLVHVYSLFHKILLFSQQVL